MDDEEENYPDSDEPQKRTISNYILIHDVENLDCRNKKEIYDLHVCHGLFPKEKTDAVEEQEEQVTFYI